jgi:hypothetical protein
LEELDVFLQTVFSSFYNFPSFFCPVQDSLVEVVNLETFLDEDFGCCAASFSASAIDGYILVGGQQIVDAAGKIFIFYIDVEAARYVSFCIFGDGSDIYQLDFRILYQLFELGGGKVLVLWLFIVACASP